MQSQSQSPVPELPRWVTGERPFASRDAEALHHAATAHGFRRRGQKNWVRRTSDFIQLINLQHSEWSPEDGYLNFALWPLAFGEPATLAESKFPFRIRCERIARDIPTLFQVADRFENFATFREAYLAGLLAHGFVHTQMRELLEAG